MLLDREEVFDLWCKFGDAIGIDLLHDIYGPYWPRKPVHGELVFRWFNDKKLIGWAAIRHDVLEPIMWVALGIFPQYQNDGYSTKIFDKTIKMGFEMWPDLQWVFAAVSKNNLRYYCYMKDQEDKWELAGEINIPEPGYTIFGLKKSKFREV